MCPSKCSDPCYKLVCRDSGDKIISIEKNAIDKPQERRRDLKCHKEWICVWVTIKNKKLLLFEILMHKWKNKMAGLLWKDVSIQ